MTAISSLLSCVSVGHGSFSNPFSSSWLIAVCNLSLTGMALCRTWPLLLPLPSLWASLSQGMNSSLPSVCLSHLFYLMALLTLQSQSLPWLPLFLSAMATQGCVPINGWHLWTLLLWYLASVLGLGKWVPRMGLESSWPCFFHLNIAFHGWYV